MNLPNVNDPQKLFAALQELSLQLGNVMAQLRNLDSNKLTLGTWLNDWFKTYKAPALKPSSLRSIEICIRLHVAQDLKDSTLANITAYELQQAINGIDSSRMRAYTYDVLSEAMEQALSNNLLTINPMQKVEKLKHVRDQGTPLSPSEIATIKAATSGQLLEYYNFILYSGCRRGEGLSARWEDVDFVKNILHIRGTKTEKSDRNVPLFPDLKNLLKGMKKATGLIFDLSSDYVSKKFSDIMPSHRLHDLRHTFATRCLECGIDTNVVKTWLGHTKIETTASIYSHVLPAFSQTEALKLKLID